MKTLRTFGLGAVGLLSAVAIVTGVVASQRNFSTHLSGGNEIPAVQTRGQGQAILKVSSDESEISFKLTTANLKGITQAHIHCGGPDVNGPVVAFLFGFDAAGVSKNGVLSEGTLTAANVIPRPDSAACPGGVANMSDLLAKMRAGEAYVNVHTIQHPPGEIRGQID
jgi:hypothetical protein